MLFVYRLVAKIRAETCEWIYLLWIPCAVYSRVMIFEVARDYSLVA
jgi:hypothetical protein